MTKIIIAFLVIAAVVILSLILPKRNKQKHRSGCLAVVILFLCALVLTGILVFEPLSGSGNQGPEAGGMPDQDVSGDEPQPPTTEELLMEYIEGMSLEEKVGQMFLIRCPETAAADSVRDYQPGGMLFFAQDFKEKEPEQFISEVAEYQSASNTPMLMSVDEEGGDVNRISWYPQYRTSPFLSPQNLFAQGGFDLIEADTAEKCQLLKSLGLNMNMAPVADVSENASDYMYGRTFGQDAEATSEYVSRVVSVMNEEQVGSVLKHFPGYGSNQDTHVGFSVDGRPYEAFTESDFLPFEAGIDAGAGAVLVSHNIVESMDAENPSSLSPEVHRVLREELGFEGVIMTDDLVMSAIVDSVGIEEAAVQAVKAGNDMLCCTDYKAQIPAVIAAVESGEITEERIEESVLRVLMWKYELGILAVPAA